MTPTAQAVGFDGLAPMLAHLGGIALPDTSTQGDEFFVGAVALEEAEQYPGFAEYQAQTTRQIPGIALERVR